MKRAACCFIFLFAGMMAVAPRAAAQDGSIEFVARATPSGGLEEPVRGFPFYLLSKSFESISEEASVGSPEPDMTAFIDTLEVSPEMKAWMKKYHTTSLAGEDFIRKLHPDDVMNVPEFYKAYMDRNSGDQSVDFPKAPKVKPSDKANDPAKYEKISAQYSDTIRRYIEQHPRSVDGIDLTLADLDPTPKWAALEAKRLPEIHRRALNLAQSKYLVARAETNLQGQGFLRGIPPGNYWISTLDVAADVGDARPRWDVPVAVRAGETQYVTLSNVNAVQTSHASP
ncbi:MAG TPA: hypothetical protein VN822_10955 [Candidatus Acidoferrales bacterium]|nr:hypothetical protein [Candidatus Acidoferrales bacterium]